jgi:excisionase family DNA binding protein
VTTLNIEQVAAHLNCDIKIVYQLAGKGEIPGAKIGRGWVFRQQDVDAYLAAQVEKQTRERLPIPALVDGRKRSGRKAAPLPTLLP